MLITSSLHFCSVLQGWRKKGCSRSHHQLTKCIMQGSVSPGQKRSTCNVRRSQETTRTLLRSNTAWLNFCLAALHLTYLERLPPTYTCMHCVCLCTTATEAPDFWVIDAQIELTRHERGRIPLWCSFTTICSIFQLSHHANCNGLMNTSTGKGRFHSSEKTNAVRVQLFQNLTVCSYDSILYMQFIMTTVIQHGAIFSRLSLIHFV